MKESDLKTGARVITHAELGSTKGMMVAARHLTARQPKTPGTLTGYVPGHGGDVWWVKHDDASVAAYCFDEMELIP